MLYRKIIKGAKEIVRKLYTKQDATLSKLKNF